MREHASFHCFDCPTTRRCPVRAAKLAGECRDLRLEASRHFRDSAWLRAASAAAQRERREVRVIRDSTRESPRPLQRRNPSSVTGKKSEPNTLGPERHRHTGRGSDRRRSA